MLKLLLIAGTVVAGAGGLVLFIGLLLPTKHVAVVAATYPESRDVVFAAISDFAAQPAWRGTVTGMERLADRDGKPAWVEVAAHGKTPIELTLVEAPVRLVTTVVSEGLPYGGSWEYVLHTVPEGTTLTITERGEVYNPVFRFVSRFVIGHHATASQYLTDLGKRFGVDVVVQRS